MDSIEGIVHACGGLIQQPLEDNLAMLSEKLNCLKGIQFITSNIEVATSEKEHNTFFYPTTTT